MKLRVVVCGLGAWAVVGCSGEAPTPAADTGGADAAHPDADGADASADVQAPPLHFCAGPVSLAYDPTGPGQISTLPDDVLTVDDPTSPTGLRVHIADPDTPWVAASPPILRQVVADLGTLDGWGTTAAVTLRFTAPIASAAVPLPSGPTSVNSPDVLLVDLDVQPPQRVPFETELTDQGATALFWPMRPLTPRHRHALVVKTSYHGLTGQCIAPSGALAQLLSGKADHPALQRMLPAYKKALQLLGLAGDDVSAMTVFTTQSTVDLSVTVAKDIAARFFDWSGPAACTDVGYARRCDRSFVAADYRQGRAVADGKPVAPWTLTATAWLPKQGKAPFPTAIFGHGLGSGRDQGSALAELASPVGIATVAIDAVSHGGHPTSDPQALATLATVIRFFAISPATQSVDGIALRDHFRQSTYDKLQLLRLLLQHPDFDGDGATDVDLAHLLYLGVSLGGIMGPEFLALAPEVRLGVLSVPGARVASIISDSAQFAPIIAIMKPKGTPDGDVPRFFPMLQTVLDAGDAAAYAPHVLADRLLGTPQQLLMQMAIGDDVVPNSCNRALARALGIAHAPPVLQEVGLLTALGATPVKGNVDGKATAALFQFDRITKDQGKPPQKADHSSTPKSLEAMTQDLAFIGAWLKDGIAEVIDPYQQLGTAKLP